MKKKNIINLIRYYVDNNDAGFRTEAYEIAKDFDKTGDFQLSEYIMALLSNTNTLLLALKAYKADVNPAGPAPIIIISYIISLL